MFGRKTVSLDDRLVFVTLIPPCDYLKTEISKKDGKRKTKQQPTWENSLSIELARLASGRSKDKTPGTNTIEWIHPHQIASHKKPTYVRICANYRPQKADPHRVRCTLGGNLINYPGPKAAPTASIPLVKLLLNSVLSTPNAKFHTIDIKDFYLQTSMERAEYMRLKILDIPKEVIQHYNLMLLVT